MPIVILTALMAVPAFAQKQPPAAVGPLARQLNDAFAGVYEKVAPSVVVIEVRITADAAVSGLPEGLEFFFRGPDGKPTQGSFEQGSGFVISPNGYIMTNCHVVESAQNGSITVRLQDGRSFPATLVGADRKSDIAVIKIDADKLPAVELGDSDAARVGQFAFALGAPYDLPYTFTVGVISAKGRDDLTHSQTYEEYIQTDAAIHPGNSGGPLCDIDGQVVGVNTMINGIDRGLGFAVPSNIAREVGAQLMAKGWVSRPWLGISLLELKNIDGAQQYFPGLEKGVVVRNIEPDAPAYDSDLRPGDVILKVDGKSIERSRDLQREILTKKIGQTVQLELWRAGHTSTISVRTGEQPEQFQRASIRTRVPSNPPSQKPFKKKKTTPAQGGYYGLLLENVPSADGVRVADVEPQSAAAVADLMPDDLITEAAGKPVKTREDLENALATADLSRGVMLIVERHGDKTFKILKP
jgi:serine protease Do